ncbi:MAG: hypothetical protein WD035_11485, partial [Balneolaceae bacterium]
MKASIVFSALSIESMPFSCPPSAYHSRFDPFSPSLTLQLFRFRSSFILILLKKALQNQDFCSSSKPVRQP